MCWGNIQRVESLADHLLIGHGEEKDRLGLQRSGMVDIQTQGPIRSWGIWQTPKICEQHGDEFFTTLFLCHYFAKNSNIEIYMRAIRLDI